MPRKSILLCCTAVLILVVAASCGSDPVGPDSEDVVEKAVASGPVGDCLSAQVITRWYKYLCYTNHCKDKVTVSMYESGNNCDGNWQKSNAYLTPGENRCEYMENQNGSYCVRGCHDPYVVDNNLGCHSWCLKLEIRDGTYVFTNECNRSLNISVFHNRDCSGGLMTYLTIDDGVEVSIPAPGGVCALDCPPPKWVQDPNGSCQ